MPEQLRGPCAQTLADLIETAEQQAQGGQPTPWPSAETRPDARPTRQLKSDEAKTGQAAREERVRAEAAVAQYEQALQDRHRKGERALNCSLEELMEVRRGRS